MSNSNTSISPVVLAGLVGGPNAPMLVDVRRRPAFDAADRLIAGAMWRDHRQSTDWDLSGQPAREVIVYCVHGHNVSQVPAAALRARGIRARFVDGGIEAFEAAGGVTRGKTAILDATSVEPSRWITHTRPAVAQLAGAWFIRRFLDPRALIHFALPEWAADMTDDLAAQPFGLSDNLMSLRAFLDQFAIADPALHRVAETDAAIETLWNGVSSLYSDDHQALEVGMTLLDAQLANYRQSNRVPL